MLTKSLFTMAFILLSVAAHAEMHSVEKREQCAKLSQRFAPLQEGLPVVQLKFVG